MAAGDIITDPTTGNIALDASGNIQTANASGTCPTCCDGDTCISGIGDDCFMCGQNTATPKYFSLSLSSIAACAGCIVADASANSANTIALHGINATHILPGAACNWQKTIAGGLTYTKYTGAGCLTGATSITADVSIVLSVASNFWRLTLTGSGGEKIFDGTFTITAGCTQCLDVVTITNSLVCGVGVGIFASGGTGVATPCTLITPDCDECSFCCQTPGPYVCKCKTPVGITATVSGVPTSWPCRPMDCTANGESMIFNGTTVDPNRTVALVRIAGCVFQADVALSGNNANYIFESNNSGACVFTGGLGEATTVHLRYTLTFLSATTFRWQVGVFWDTVGDYVVWHVVTAGSPACSYLPYKDGTYTKCTDPFSLTHDDVKLAIDEDLLPGSDGVVSSGGSTTFTPSCT